MAELEVKSETPVEINQEGAHKLQTISREPTVWRKPLEKKKEVSRLDLLANQLDMPALTPEVQTPQKTFGYNLSFWKLCLEARRIRNEEKNDTTKPGRDKEMADRNTRS